MSVIGSRPPVDPADLPAALEPGAGGELRVAGEQDRGRRRADVQRLADEAVAVDDGLVGPTPSVLPTSMVAVHSKSNALRTATTAPGRS